jgi:hypothetical protein
MQANGAEMLRLACCLATERGVRVCAPVHDATMLEAASDELEAVVTQTQDVMMEASELVLDGFRLRSEARLIRHPDRFTDERGKGMWETVCSILDDLSCATMHTEPLHECSDTCAGAHIRPI